MQRKHITAVFRAAMYQSARPFTEGEFTPESVVSCVLILLSLFPRPAWCPTSPTGAGQPSSQIDRCGVLPSAGNW